MQKKKDQLICCTQVIAFERAFLITILKRSQVQSGPSTFIGTFDFGSPESGLSSGQCPLKELTPVHFKS